MRTLGGACLARTPFATTHRNERCAAVLARLAGDSETYKTLRHHAVLDKDGLESSPEEAVAQGKKRVLVVLARTFERDGNSIFDDILRDSYIVELLRLLPLRTTSVDDDFQELPVRLGDSAAIGKARVRPLQSLNKRSKKLVLLARERRNRPEATLSVLRDSHGTSKGAVA